MERIYTESDVNRSALKGQTIAIIGYGSQGRAHARNLRDSGHDVIVGARAGGKADRTAKADGFRTVSPADAAKEAKLVALLTPDMAHRAVYADDIKPNLAPGAALLVAHGFSVLYGQVEPRDDIDVILVAPKGPGDLVRREYEIGRGVPALFAVLCGGASELINAGFETLVEAGYKPEVAYFECLHELKLIVDLLYEGGLAKMHSFISETAKYGDLVSGPRVINAETKARMKEVLTDIQTGQFARDWIAENESGKKKYDAMMQADLDLPLEKVGAELRSHMAWLNTEPKTEAKAA